MRSEGHAVTSTVAAIIVVAIVAAASVALIYGYAGSSRNATTTITSTQIPFITDPPNLPALAQAEGGTLTIYSIEDPTTFALHTWPAFQQIFPWAKVNFVGLDPGSLISRPIAEYKSGHVTADVEWWGPLICGQLDSAGVIQHYDMSAIEKQQGYSASQITSVMTPTIYVANVVFYNTNLANDSNPKAVPIPKSYADLANPVYKGKLALANPVLNDSPGATYVGMFVDQPNNATWTATMKGIANNEVVEPFGGQAYTDVSQGTYAIGIDTQNDVVNGIAAGLPVAIDWNIPVVYLLVDDECIMKGAPHPYMAQLFSQWEMSASSGPAEVGGGFMPAQPDALKTALATVVPSGVTATPSYQYYNNYTFWSRALTNIFGSG